MRFYDSFSPDPVDAVYYQAIAEGICEFSEDSELHEIFNDNEEKIK